MPVTRLHVVALCAAVSSVGYGLHASIRTHHPATATAGRASDPHHHHQPLSELDASAASHVAVRSGDWSDPDTWAAVAPTAGARVVIPRGVTVTITAPVAAPLEWVRVDGRLDFSAADSSQLTVTTMLVASTGRLSIGTADRTVDAARTVRLLFAPRSDAVRRRDRFDMLGGLIVLGHVSIFQGTLFDEAAGPEIVRRTYDALKVDDDGSITVPFEYPDRAGNLFRHAYRLTVTTRAARRGSDLMYFAHRTAVH